MYKRQVIEIRNSIYLVSYTLKTAEDLKVLTKFNHLLCFFTIVVVVLWGGGGGGGGGERRSFTTLSATAYIY